jgi:hypothetical protein
MIAFKVLVNYTRMSVKNIITTFIRKADLKYGKEEAQ